MKEFEFTSGAYQDDTTSAHAARAYAADSMHGAAATWNQTDLFTALGAHAKKFGPYRTKAVMYQIVGVIAGVQVPPSFYGVLIAYLCRDMVGRPNRVKSNA